ncbi:MAG TPA: LuxR family transcriptional regulator, partial [Ruminiclostridium sp.]|nr:LuxR family transcriptional regulator [Ruminiclostridium sp.]
MKKLKMLKRERVNRALESIFDFPLTVIEAPMGYGKTTAVREFLTVKGCTVMWISFFSTEDTVSFFWNELSKEIGRLYGMTGISMKSLGFPADAPQMANILSILNNIDYEENTVLVIDDFHFVKDTQIGSFLEQIVKEELGSLRIVVITRDTTNLNFVEIIAKGLCNIISQKLLKFSDEEIRDYCSAAGFIPSEDDLKKIGKYTGGWISLIYLTLLGLEQGIPVGMNRAIGELVENVLYNSYDESIQRFLLRLSVMDSFTAEQALYVTQESRTDELLKRLHRENAFITLDEAAGVYKIHNVLLDFLRMKRNAELKELYTRAGEWHLKRKERMTAYGYFCRAGETELILSLLNNEENVTMELAEFDGWLQMFETAPRELLFKYPFAYLQYILSLLFNGDEETAPVGAKRLDELQKFIERQENMHPNLKKRILAENTVARIFTVFNDAGRMIDCT